MQMEQGQWYSVSGSKVMSLKLVPVVQVGPAKSVNYCLVGWGGSWRYLLHTVLKAFMPMAVPLSVWKAPCIICQDVAFYMSTWKAQAEGGWCSGTHFGPAPTLCFLCTSAHQWASYSHWYRPKRCQLHHFLCPNSGFDDDTNIHYFCTNRIELRKARGMADGSCSLPGVEVYRDSLSGVFTHYLFIWYFLKKSQCSSGLSIMYLCDCTHVHNYL